jgi:hypothetical protein
MANPNRIEITSNCEIFRFPELNSESYISNTRVSLISESYILPKQSTILCDGSIHDDIVTEFGSNVYIGVLTQTTDENRTYQTGQRTYTWIKTIALVLEYTSEDDANREGIVTTGGITFSFKNSDERYLSVNNLVKYCGQNYTINKILKHPAADTTYYIEVLAE